MPASSLTRRGFLAAQAALLSSAARPRPNVILLVTDDQGYGDLGCHGNPYVKTPNLDRLHSQSVRFTNFHVDPLCAPTRAGLLTGQYALRNSVTAATGGWSLLRPGVPTLADIFRRNGYRTGIFGKWHLGENHTMRPPERGFDESIVCRSGGIAQAADYWGYHYFDDHYYRHNEPAPFQGYCTDVFFREASDFIRRHRDRPFFLYLPTNAPHAPYLVSEKYSDPYKTLGVPSPAAEFYGMIANIDENAGKLFQSLDAEQLTENTIFIYMTDNGSAAGNFSAGMRGIKGSAYEGGHRAPLFVRWPAAKWKTARDVAQLTCHLDLLPTLVELCGLEKPSNSKPDGRSLAPLLSGDAQPVDRTHFIEHHQVVIDGKYQMDTPEPWRNAVALTNHWRLVKGSELYDMTKDASQQQNVAGQNPEVVRRLSGEYERWWEEVKAAGFGKWTRIPIGTSGENPTGLTCFDWHGDYVPSNQQMVEKAMVANGTWALRAERGGRYQVILRQRPAYVTHQIEGDRASVRINGRMYTKPIEKGAGAIAFDVDLAPGDVDLWTEIARAGESRGAYYVDVRHA
jgi:arylsulfatase A-like enzyme